MADRTLTQKVTGILKKGARRNESTKGYHVDFGGRLNQAADSMAIESEYSVGDEIEYVITVRRKTDTPPPQ